MRRIAVLLAATALLAGCHSSSAPEDDTGTGTGITFERNSQFSTQYMRVFLNLRDGTPLSVNTLDDAVSSAEAEAFIPGHAGREWMFLKEEDHGTSKVHAIASWDPDDPEDYLMVGWWAYFPGQQPPDLDPFDWQGSTIVDGPEFDQEVRPPDMPVAGTASYQGPALGTYSFRPADRPEDISPDIETFYVADGWQGHATLTTDFGEGMVHGCIGCDGDLTHRDALVPIRHPDVQLDITGYEIHMLAHPFDPETGTIDGGTSEVRHPAHEVIVSDGGWGGFFSNRPDEAGNPRILGGFAWNSFSTEGGPARLVGLFIGLSEDFAE